MKYARQLLVSFCIFISVLSFLSLCGCVRGYYRENNRGDRMEERHYYRDGRWYKHDSRGNEIAVVNLVIGMPVVSLPPQHTTVVVQDVPYYHDGDHYYRQEPKGGYVVVSPPVMVQSQSQGKHDKREKKGR